MHVQEKFKSLKASQARKIQSIKLQNTSLRIVDASC